MADNKSNQVALRFFFLIAIGMFVVCTLMMPWMLRSILQEAQHSLDEKHLPFTPEGLVAESAFTKLHVDVVAIDEPNRLATLRVSGFHTCKEEKKCAAYKERVIFFEVDEDDTRSETAPPSAIVEIPSSSEEISKRITLPIKGSFLTYPFDTYKLGIGVALQREFADKTVHELTPAETAGKLLMTIQEQVPRVEMTEFKLVAILKLIEAHGISADEVTGIEVGFLPGSEAALVSKNPTTGLDGKFSVEYVAAALLVDGNLSLDTFSDAMVMRPEIRALMSKVKRYRIEAEGTFSGTIGYTDVAINTRRGSFSIRQEHAPGSPQEPMTPADIREKFMDCSRGFLGEAGARSLLGQLEKLMTAGNVADLLRDAFPKANG